MKRYMSLLLLSLAFVTLGMASLGEAGVSVGTKAPDFSLTDTNGNQRSLSDYKGQYVVLEWTNYQCPFVVKHYESGNMQGLQSKYTAKGVTWLTIGSSAPGKQGYFEPAGWNDRVSKQQAKPTAVLLDSKGDVGRAYGAQTTPHMYVVNPEGDLIYMGAIDDTPSMNPDDIESSVNYVDQALTQSMNGQSVSTPSTKAYGCSVKY